MKVIVTIIFLILSGCSNNNNSHNVNCTNSEIRQDLYDILRSYQQNNPVPSKVNNKVGLPPMPETEFKYIYEVQFKKEEDTTVIITLRPDGIQTPVNNFESNIYGVYQDSCLKPTYFIIQNNYGNDFIKKFKVKGVDDFRYNNSSIIDIIYIQYIYRIINSKLIFIKKIKGNIGQ
jgi:hypothetical protein